jgi:altronate hydrolase
MNNVKWKGYKRLDGRIGIRNKILVIYTVECSMFVANEIVRQLDDSEIECIGFKGCTDNEYAVRMISALIKHPNVGGALIIGLGCEYLQPKRFAEIASKSGKESSWFYIQENGGTKTSIEKGINEVQTIKEKLKSTEIVEMGIEDLVIGAECGGSDFTSGLAGNVVVGRLYDMLVDYNGTAIFEEIVEAIGLVDLLSSRAKDQKAKEEIESTYYKALEYCKSVRQYSVSPGNFAGGLSTIEEKSMGAIVKSGTRQIEGVLKVSQRVPHKGLWLLDSTPDPHWMSFGITNPNDNEGLLDLISTGAQLVFLVTGRGNVVGSAVSPVIKITGNDSTYNKLKDDMDFNAGGILMGSETIDDSAKRLLQLVIDVCSGRKSKSEALGHKEYYIPYKYQDKGVVLKRKCE